MKTGKNAYKLPYDKFNQVYGSMTDLIKDIKRLQKESKYYKLIYSYNEIREDISDNKSGVNIREAYKKGSPIQLYGMVEYYSAENIERYKNLLASMPYPKKNWYDSENEDYIQDIEQKIYDEFDKHLDILGFSEDKSESYKLKSSKYPGIYIHMKINGDGAYFTIYPDYPKDVFILGDESENDLNNKTKKKLNEDHSEISNDPEMEELMALAGVTTADLDDLENDNDLDLDEDDPIDANTLREIDAAMDESVKSAINNIELATKGMDVNIEQIEKFIPVAKDFMKYVKSAPIAYDENTGDGLKIKNDTVDFINKCVKFDYDRGSDAELKVIGRNWIKYNLATLFDKLSFNNKKVSPAQLELYKKCVKDGEFDKRLQKCYNELKAILKELNDFYDQLAKKLGPDFEKTVNYKMLNSFGNEYNYFWRQYCFTTGDKNATMKYAGRTRVSFFGKRVRDSINESIGDFVRDTKTFFKNASDFLKHRKENSKSKSKDSEADIKNSPVYKDAIKKLDAFGESIAEKVVTHLKEYATKNNFKSVYNNTAFNINDIKYCPINGYDVQVSDLQDGIDYNQVNDWKQKNPEKDWQKEPQFNNDWYDELLTEGEEFAKSLLQKDCPDIYDYYVNTGDGDEGLVYIDISLSSAYINSIKEDAKKPQNESADTDLNILLAESAEFLLEE